MVFWMGECTRWINYSASWISDNSLRRVAKLNLRRLGKPSCEPMKQAEMQEHNSENNCKYIGDERRNDWPNKVTKVKVSTIPARTAFRSM